MAKWKNALLISTIVAPIAFGAGPLGDVLAAPINDKGTSSTATDVVVHKYLNTQDKGNNYYGEMVRRLRVVTLLEVQARFLQQMVGKKRKLDIRLRLMPCQVM